MRIGLLCALGASAASRILISGFLIVFTAETRSTQRQPYPFITFFSAFSAVEAAGAGSI
jgi:hypothetical protein